MYPRGNNMTVLKIYRELEGLGSEYLIISELELFTLQDAIFPWEGQMISVECIGTLLKRRLGSGC